MRNHFPFADGRLARRNTLVLAAVLAACSQAAQSQQPPASLELKSSGFTDSIPALYTCKGADTSPELSWSAPPAGTQSLVLLVEDPDAPLASLVGAFVHWVMYRIPAGTRELAASVPNQGQLPDGSRQGKNGFDKIGYGGPCPPGSKAHRYVFTLYALDVVPDLPEGASESQVTKAMKGHILAQGQLTGRFSAAGSGS
jgi:Raf kinase inhibitor-like YbhB/YbcL family protein